MRSSASRRSSTLSIPAEPMVYAPAAKTTSGTNGGGQVAVELASVTKRFGKITALDDVSLTVRRGELLTLLGPSGCGKTTLLHLIAGFLMPDSGEIAIDGRRVTDVVAYRREIGIMFQNYALFPHMTVAGNVGYGLRMRRIAKPEMTRRMADALALVKLAGLEDRKPRQLSGGQQQRVALARALVIRPRVLLLDTPHEVYRHPADRFVASFIGDANVLRARLERIEGSVATVVLGAARVAVPTRTLEGSAVGGAVDLFVRPEDVRVAAPDAVTAAHGIVAAQIYQGGHIDLYVDAPEVSSGCILLRVPSHEAASPPPPGTRIGIALAGDVAIAFRSA